MRWGEGSSLTRDALSYGHAWSRYAVVHDGPKTYILWTMVSDLVLLAGAYCLLTAV